CTGFGRTSFRRTAFALTRLGLTGFGRTFGTDRGPGIELLRLRLADVFLRLCLASVVLRLGLAAVALRRGRRDLRDAILLRGLLPDEVAAATDEQQPDDRDRDDAPDAAAHVALRPLVIVVDAREPTRERGLTGGRHAAELVRERRACARRRGQRR